MDANVFFLCVLSTETKRDAPVPGLRSAAKTLEILPFFGSS